MATSSRGTENKWTPDEDEILRAAVEKYGKKNSWQKISSCLPGRTNKSCRKRWVHSLDPTLRKGRWTAAEDAQLLEAVRVHGKYWWQVARHIEGRTDDQCAKRWREKLDPSISRHAWTKQEDEILLAACETHGKKWNVISKMLPGRPAVHCRNRYQSLQRSLAASSSTATLRPPSVVSSDSSYSESFSSRSPEMNMGHSYTERDTRPFDNSGPLRVVDYGLTTMAGFAANEGHDVHLMPPSPVPSSPSSSDNPAFGMYFHPQTEHSISHSLDGGYRQHAHDAFPKYPGAWPNQRFAGEMSGQDLRPGSSHSSDHAPGSLHSGGNTGAHSGLDCFDKTVYPAHRRDSYGTLSRASTSRPGSAPYIHGITADSPFPTSAFLAPQSRASDAGFSGIGHMHSRSSISDAQRRGSYPEPTGSRFDLPPPSNLPESRVSASQGPESFLGLLSSDSVASVYGAHPSANNNEGQVPSFRIDHAGEAPAYGTRW